MPLPPHLSLALRACSSNLLVYSPRAVLTACCPMRPIVPPLLLDDALVPAAAAVSHLLGASQAGQALAGARGKEGLSQGQLAALTRIPQRYISE